jgi:hypothetical protein
VCGRTLESGYNELKECSAEWRRMANNSEEGQGPQRAVVPVVMMMMMMMNHNHHIDTIKENRKFILQIHTQ